MEHQKKSNQPETVKKKNKTEKELAIHVRYNGNLFNLIITHAHITRIYHSVLNSLYLSSKSSNCITQRQSSTKWNRKTRLP